MCCTIRGDLLDGLRTLGKHGWWIRNHRSLLRWFSEVISKYPIRWLPIIAILDGSLKMVISTYIPISNRSILAFTCSTIKTCNMYIRLIDDSGFSPTWYIRNYYELTNFGNTVVNQQVVMAEDGEWSWWTSQHSQEWRNTLGRKNYLLAEHISISMVSCQAAA